MQQVGSSLMIRFDPASPAVDHLQAGENWCVFVDAATMQTFAQNKLNGPLGQISGHGVNFDCMKFLRARIPQDLLRKSEIRTIMTATDIEHGTARYFSNVPVDVLLKDPEVQEELVRREVEQPSDLVHAAVASSAYTFTYEAVPMDGRVWTDGGIVSNQPILPALRLGADVLFLVLVTPLEGDDNTGEVKTFLDRRRANPGHSHLQKFQVRYRAAEQCQPPLFHLRGGEGRSARAD